MELDELTTVMKLLDRIITSNRPEIKDAFRELLVITALAEQGGDLVGPLESLTKEVSRMRNELEMVHYELQRRKDEQQPYQTTTGTSYPYTSAGTGPTAIYNPTGTTGMTASTNWGVSNSIKVTQPSFLDLGNI